MLLEALAPEARTFVPCAPQTESRARYVSFACKRLSHA